MPDGRVRVRRANEMDFQAVARLLGELGRPALTPETDRPAHEVYLRHVTRPDTASLIAEVEGEAVGFLSLEFRERLNRTTLQAWIPDLIVTEAHRGTGAGKALLLHAFDMARHRGCWAVTLESGFQREVAHAFYEGLGMTRDGYYFTHLLE
jgi:GNAT superfamily N-acetyltransferase